MPVHHTTRLAQQVHHAGRCHGCLTRCHSVWPMVTRRGELRQSRQDSRDRIKLEGIDALYNATLGCIDLLLVSDADDPEVPAPLFAARLMP